MKRIIYSIFTDDLDPGHKSSSDFKLSQFKKYKKHLEKAQKDYAHLCGAEYHLFDTKNTAYDMIQFEKIFKLEELINDYDEVLYLDFDVVPNTKLNFFEVWDLNSICAYNIDRTPDRDRLIKSLAYDNFDAMNIYCKTCAKNAMLELDGLNGSNGIINTGVVGGNVKSIMTLNFTEQFKTLNDTLLNAIDDNLYPKEVYRHWKSNNEIFVTYLIERYNLPFINIGLAWNFLMDDLHPEISAAGHFLHHVKKEFQRSFGEI